MKNLTPTPPPHPRVGEADGRGDSRPVRVVFDELNILVPAKMNGRVVSIASQQVECLQQLVPFEPDGSRVRERTVLFQGHRTWLAHIRHAPMQGRELNRGCIGQARLGLTIR